MQSITEVEEREHYQILITGITWKESSTRLYSPSNKGYSVELPDTFTLDVPENVLNQANKKQNVFEDVIESYVYNWLTHHFMHEVYHCQIWLPLETNAVD